jgi:TM2 domain-containing membrane protein YozV
MRIIKQGFVFAFLCTLVIGLSSAKLISLNEQEQTTTAVIQQKTSVASNMSFKELKEAATALKGEKLTLKEKIALKLFKKKIGSASSATAAGGGKSQVIALILVLAVGVLGIHRFYLGYTWQGIVQLLTLGGCGIWSLIDLIRIITGDLKPKDGEYETTL